MKRKSTSDYPVNWPAIAKRVKDEAGWKCMRCGHDHDPETGFTLTVHHLDLSPANNEWWNLAALCQRCHLHIQGRVLMQQPFMFDHSEWFKPFVAGYYAWLYGRTTDREYVEAHLEDLLAYGKP